MTRERETGTLGKLRKSVAARVIAGGIALAAVGGAAAGCAEASASSATTKPETATTQLQKTEIAKVDLTGIVPEGQKITEPVNVPADLQKDFTQSHRGYKLLYVSGDTALTDMPFIYENASTGMVFDSFGGYDTQTKTENGVPSKISMVYKEKEAINGSEDYYIKGVDPLTGKDVKVRVVNEGMTRNISFGENTTCFYAFDLSKNYQPVWASRNNPNIQMRAHATEDVFKSGDILDISTTIVETIGDSNAPKLFCYTGVVDKAGVPEASVIFIPKIKNVEQVTNLYAAK